MGRFFFVESKFFEFIIEPEGNSFRLQMVERGKGYIWSISLGRDGVFWLFLMVDDLAKIGNNVGFIHKIRDS
jgi:hypothetical protein